MRIKVFYKKHKDDGDYTKQVDVNILDDEYQNPISMLTKIIDSFNLRGKFIYYISIEHTDEVKQNETN